MKYILTLLITLITYNAYSMRVVAVGSGLTEIVYAIGAETNLVGNCVSSNYPDEAKELPKVGYQRMLPSEGIISLYPDVVFITDETGPESVIKQLVNAGIDVIRLHSGRSLNDIVSNVEKISSYLNLNKEGQSLISTLKKDHQLLNKSISNLGEKPSDLFILGHGGVARVAGKETAANSIIEMSGADNVIKGFYGYKPVSPEQYVNFNPDFILTTTFGVDAKGGEEKFKNMAGVKETRAAKEGNILIFDAQYLLGFGPRTIEAALELNQKY